MNLQYADPKEAADFINIVDHKLSDFEIKGALINALDRARRETIMKRPLQLSDPLGYGVYAKDTVEQVIDKDPQYMECLVEEYGKEWLAVGAQRYLQDVLSEQS